MLEFLLVMPLLFVMIMAVLQLAHIWTARQVVKYAAYCAARATLTSNQAMALRHANAAAKQVCAWITFSEPASELKKVRGGTSVISDPFLRDVSVTNAENTVNNLNSLQGQLAQSVLNSEVAIPGWGTIPGSSSLNSRLRVYGDYKSDTLHSSLYPWQSRVTVEFDFPLLMPVAGKMLSYLVNQEWKPLKKDLDSGSAGYLPVRGWTGQQEILSIEKEYEKHAFPYITLRETSIVPKPYSTDAYPVTSACLEL